MAPQSNGNVPAPAVYLVAIDTTSSATHVLEIACGLGKALGGAAELHILHVIGVNNPAPVMGAASLVTPTEALESGRGVLDRACADAAPRFQGRIAGHLAAGDPWRDHPDGLEPARGPRGRRDRRQDRACPNGARLGRGERRSPRRLPGARGSPEGLPRARRPRDRAAVPGLHGRAERDGPRPALVRASQHASLAWPPPLRGPAGLRPGDDAPPPLNGGAATSPRPRGRRRPRDRSARRDTAR